ncbi:MAG: dolichol-phosphate mannosyltransferase [Gammaproteobacteria bacterium HGW-Gammaproteobacteria-8]|nr:MAG: dolichol-phosphate mannosyltransferase [Gammaproteobacteria bacterium HGW-Gammaproteobacteria-8]
MHPRPNPAIQSALPSEAQQPRPRRTISQEALHDLSVAPQPWQDPHPLAPEPSSAPTSIAKHPSEQSRCQQQNQITALGLDCISFVVPVFNEADCIADLVEEIEHCGRMLTADFEIIVVDDGSTDHSLEVLRELIPQRPGLRVIPCQSNGGQSRAICIGVQAARYGWIVTLDGDGQNVPGDTRRLVEALLDHAQASRVGMVTGCRVKRRDRWIKRVGSRIANRVRMALLDDGVSDTGCGLKLFQRKLFLELPRFDHMHRFLPALARMHGVEVIEVEVGHRPRSTGVSKYGTLDRLRVGVPDLFGVLWLKHRAMQRPVLMDRDQ